MFIGRYSRAWVPAINLCLFLAFYNLVNAFPSDRSTLTSFSGLETTFFSEESGLPYLTIGYEEAALEKPKFGFLKFGIPFLKVKELFVRLDLRYGRTEDLFSKWNDLVTQQAIRYATLEPIFIHLTDEKGDSCLLKADKGKLNASGRLVAWGNASIDYKDSKELCPRLIIDIDDSKSCLVIDKNITEKIYLLIK